MKIKKCTEPETHVYVCKHHLTHDQPMMLKTSSTTVYMSSYIFPFLSMSLVTAFFLNATDIDGCWLCV